MAGIMNLIAALLVASSVAGFQEVGLEPPTISSVEWGGCEDGTGGHYSSSGHITICRADWWLVDHEVAHAWIDDYVGKEQRQAYMDIFDLESWNSPDTPWDERGVEHAANTLMYGAHYERQGFNPLSERVQRAYELLIVPQDA